MLYQSFEDLDVCKLDLNTCMEIISKWKRTDLSLIRPRSVVPSNETLLTMCRIFSLDAGEIEALALMEQVPQAMFLTDDAAARLVAEQMAYNVHGTIGILI